MNLSIQSQTNNERRVTVLKSITTTLFFSIMLIMMPSFNSSTADLTDEDELILVVGASGRTGSYVIKYLKEEGRNFIAMTSNKERATKKFGEKYNWIEADVKKSESLDSIMIGVTKIISGLGTNEFEGIVHTIVRAGGLTNEESAFKGVRMQQGDSVAVNGGMTSRGNLAAICIEPLSDQNAKNKTFEAFDDETIKPDTWQNSFSTLLSDEKQ